MRGLELQAQEANVRLDKFLASQVPDLSRSAAQRLVESGAATVNGEPAKASYKVTPGDEIIVYLPDESPTWILPEPILPILFLGYLAYAPARLVYRQLFASRRVPERKPGSLDA